MKCWSAATKPLAVQMPLGSGNGVKVLAEPFAEGSRALASSSVESCTPSRAPIPSIRYERLKVSLFGLLYSWKPMFSPGS